MALVDHFGRPLEEGSIIVWPPANKVKDGQIIQILEPLVTNKNQQPVRKLLIMAVYEYILPPNVQQIPDIYLIGKQELPEYLQSKLVDTSVVKQ